MTQNLEVRMSKVYTTLGASNHTDKERESNDFYATDPISIEKLLEVEKLNNDIWECACGEGHLSEVLKKHEHRVYSTDLINRGYGISGIDFLNCKNKYKGDIVTNPPYKYAKEFVLKGLDLLEDGNKLCLFLKVQFLEGIARKKEIYDKFSPKTVYVFSKRVLCAKNADFERMKAGGGSAVAYAWYVWEKGYQGETVIKWI